CDVNLRGTSHPEFDAWRWHDYWVPLDVVIEFKREVYQQALQELSRFLSRPGHGPRRAEQAGRIAHPHKNPGQAAQAQPCNGASTPETK
ncbi:hypothetical protein ABTD78_19995, partial [Acinetobacter baumannii]